MNDREQTTDSGQSRGRRSELQRIIFTGTIGAAIGMVLILVATRFMFPEASYISVKLPNGECVEIVKSDEGVDFCQMLDSMFADSFAKEGAVCWLRENKGLYHFDDPKLAECLAGLLPNELPGLLPDSTEARTNRLNQLIDSHQVIKDLRQRADNHEPPFQYVGKTVKIGVPAGTQPRAFRANVPFDSEFAGRVIKIEDARKSKHLILFGWPAFAKTDNVDMQLNVDQATYLFTRVAHPTANGVATILPGGGKLLDRIGSRLVDKQSDDL